MSESQLGPSCHCCLPADSVEMQGHVPRFPSQPASFSRLAEVETTTCVRNPQSQWRTVKPSLKAEQNGLHVVESFDLFLTGENDGTVVSIPSDWIFVHHHCWYPYDIPMISPWLENHQQSWGACIGIVMEIACKGMNLFDALASPSPLIIAILLQSMIYQWIEWATLS